MTNVPGSEKVQKLPRNKVSDTIISPPIGDSVSVTRELCGPETMFAFSHENQTLLLNSPGHPNQYGPDQDCDFFVFYGVLNNIQLFV